MTRDELMKKAAECDLGRVVGPLDTLLDDEWETLHRFVEFCGCDDLTREQNRSQMFAELVRGVAVALHGPGYSDTSKLAEEVGALKAENKALRTKIASAYAYLWLVNNEPGTPHQYPPEKAAYKARTYLRDLLTKEQRGEAINAALLAVRGAAIDAAKGGGNG